MIKKNGKTKKIKRTETESINNIKSTTNTSNIEVTNEEGYISERFYFDDFFDDGKLKKFVSNIESSIRKSDEYSNYIAGIRTGYGIDKCAIFGNISPDKEIDLEFHHYPLTLYDIVYTEVYKAIEKGEKINSFIITERVLKLHYEHKVGLVSLSTLAHKLAHTGDIFINLNSVFGKYQEYLEENIDYIPFYLKENYNKLVEMTENNIAYSGSNILQYIEDKNNEDILSPTENIDENNKTLIENK